MWEIAEDAEEAAMRAELDKMDPLEAAGGGRQRFRRCSSVEGSSEKEDRSSNKPYFTLKNEKKSNLCTTIAIILKVSNHESKSSIVALEAKEWSTDEKGQISKEERDVSNRNWSNSRLLPVELLVVEVSSSKSSKKHPDVIWSSIEGTITQKTAWDKAKKTSREACQLRLGWFFGPKKLNWFLGWKVGFAKVRAACRALPLLLLSSTKNLGPEEFMNSASSLLSDIFPRFTFNGYYATVILGLPA
ncbi:hypothetical protein HPP92_022915 [Vanilla planifolia]|uniref:Uncharacterized protein n=1 Tax=Vanilla planifolia TaxID=51239 RepID=A0A835UFJ9_VANPL|nr:hypothetical protein HPP92_022915 [Vanilla planifolia]